MRKTTLVLIIALGALMSGVALAACGGGDSGSADAVSSQEATAEIDEIKTMLDDGLSKYRSGEAEAAEQIVGDAYLEHFEKVEHPLEERDPELMEKLEKRISTEIRDEMKSGTEADTIASLIDETKMDLDTAKAKLSEPEST
jgi:hypothetical protein